MSHPLQDIDPPITRQCPTPYKTCNAPEATINQSANHSIKVVPESLPLLLSLLLSPHVAANAELPLPNCHCRAATAKLLLLLLLPLCLKSPKDALQGEYYCYCHCQGATSRFSFSQGESMMSETPAYGCSNQEQHAMQRTSPAVTHLDHCALGTHVGQRPQVHLST